MRLFLIAFQFLTIIPLPFSIRCEREDMGRSLACFPLVGLVIGALLAGINWLIAPWIARPLTDALLITTLAIVTGALHLDGLADVCDGLAARGDRQRFLDIMKDSHVGAIGAVGLILALLLKWQALAAVPAACKWQALLLFPALARFGQVIAITGAAHARQDGLGSAFIQGAAVLQLFIAALFAIPASWFLFGLRGIAVMLAVITLSIAVRSFFSRRLGGLTGDIIGCISELNEIIVLTGLSLAIG